MGLQYEISLEILNPNPSTLKQIMSLNVLKKEEGMKAFILYNSWVVAVTPK